MPTLVYIDAPADDIKREQIFYGVLFGWPFEKHGGPIESYQFTTTAIDGSPGLNGGISPRSETGQQILNYVGSPR